MATRKTPSSAKSAAATTASYQHVEAKGVKVIDDRGNEMMVVNKLEGW